MNERDKIIEIVLNMEITGISLQNIIGGSALAIDIADTLLANGICDVESYKKDMKNMMKSRDDWEYKAKLTEAALEEACEDKANYISPCTTLGILFDAAIYKREYLQKAKTKIKED